MFIGSVIIWTLLLEPWKMELCSLGTSPDHHPQLHQLGEEPLCPENTTRAALHVAVPGLCLVLLCAPSWSPRALAPAGGCSCLFVA